ncbi:putative Fumarate hydratase class II [Paratrimastix pyriformis]|uniref:fumarate hydratase n=1 Tax=Paratrimastix pyriformis TaxID=342808 RepID=A0ABQ8U785_9EUKA|nr:putative Fumarate hydratase class II [Paratrimastix pyriformis]
MEQEGRTESDTFGTLSIPHGIYWGAQTQRCIDNFSSFHHQAPIPFELIHALALMKHACCLANRDFGDLSSEKATAIATACAEIYSGRHDRQFPLTMWQIGSGTASNMNVNEVIANRAIELMGGQIGSKKPVHPNDDVNLAQSTNDIMPSAMNVATVRSVQTRLLPALRHMAEALEQKAQAFQDIVKIGRTHLMDATPLTLGQEFASYYAQVLASIQRVDASLSSIRDLPIGGTAVGNGMNSRPGFGERVVHHLNRLTENLFAFTATGNKLSQMAAHDGLVAVSGSIKATATAMHKIAFDLRLLGSGPRCGLNELALPANEPGSSIMPGKVNPTQPEAMAMASVQVIGLDTAVSMAGALGHLELNTYKPLIIANILTEVNFPEQNRFHPLCQVDLLVAAITSVTDRCIVGLQACPANIQAHLERSLMLVWRALPKMGHTASGQVTALSPHIGYDSAAKIALYAHEKGCTLQEAAQVVAQISPARFREMVDPYDMVGPRDAKPKESGQ